MRHRDIHLLTANDRTYTSDMRFSSFYNTETGVWSLQVHYNYLFNKPLATYLITYTLCIPCCAVWLAIYTCISDKKRPTGRHRNLRVSSGHHTSDWHRHLFVSRPWVYTTTSIVWFAFDNTPIFTLPHNQLVYNYSLVCECTPSRAHHVGLGWTRHLHKCWVDDKSDVHHLQYARSAELCRLDAQQSGKLIYICFWKGICVPRSKPQRNI